MKQVWIIATGGRENLQLREAPELQPQAGQLRIRVRASGVNFADILARRGLYPDAPKLPAVIGYEVSGVVDAVGRRRIQPGSARMSLPSLTFAVMPIPWWYPRSRPSRSPPL